MKYFRKLSGEKIYLSPMNPEDAPIYTRWMNNMDMTNNLSTSAVIFSVAAEEQWIRDNQSDYQFAIVRSEDDTLLGNCGIQELNHLNQTAEVGLFIGDEENRGKGYGQEALRLLLGFCFHTLNIHNVMLTVYSFNERAIHTYQKIGFREFGRRHECYYLNGSRYDKIYMELLRSDYLTPSM